MSSPTSPLLPNQSGPSPTSLPWYRVFWDSLTKKKQMTDRDRFELSPWQKWEKYRRIPLKLVLHVLLIAFILAQVAMLIVQFNYYGTASTQTFAHFFVPNNIEGSVKVFTIDEALTRINQTVQTFYTFPDISLDHYLHRSLDYPVMEVKYYTHSFIDQIDRYSFTHFSTATEKKSYNLTLSEPLGPFQDLNHTELQIFFYKIISMNIHLQFENLDYGQLGPILFQWNVNQRYDFSTGGGNVKIFLETSKEIIEYQQKTFSIFAAFNVLIGSFSFFSFILAGKALVKNSLFYWRTRKRFNEKVAAAKLGATLQIGNIQIKEDNSALLKVYQEWESIPLSIRLHFFDLWQFVLIIGNILLIVACLGGLLVSVGSGAMGDRTPLGYSYLTEEWFSLTFGLGGGLTIISIIKYLEFGRKFYLLIYTLKNALNNILRFIISITPVFLAYAIFGLLAFSNYLDEFSNFTKAFYTLFSALNGDSLLLVFTDLTAKYPYPIIGELYFYSFLVLFITAVLNIFIFIIEDAYHIAKTWSKSHVSKIVSKSEPQRGHFDIHQLFEIIEPQSAPSMPRPQKPEKLNKETVRDMLDEVTSKLSDDLNDTVKDLVKEQTTELDNKFNQLLLQISQLQQQQLHQQQLQQKQLEQLEERNQKLQTQLQQIQNSQQQNN